MNNQQFSPIDRLDNGNNNNMKGLSEDIHPATALSKAVWKQKNS